MSEQENTTPTNFIRNIIDEDLKSGKHKNIVTRFPPEPNGYLHIGHTKSISLNFGIAKDYNGVCHLRFDDTNPEKEDEEYVNSIMDDIKWLGFDWKDKLFHASDYFEKMYEYAVELIKLGKAYVCSLNAEELRAHRGTLTEPGKNSPDRERSVEENLELFEKMKNGEFEDGTYTLRAKIDMASPNMNMRDPAIYRIKHMPHQRTGDKWCIYPMYDYAHCLSDAIEGITHSLCTLEFEDHRPLYDWFLDELKTPCHPQQIEFARLNLDYTVMSKRKIIELVKDNHVSGWDDPRMPTISALRRRGIPAEAIRDFCTQIGVGKANTSFDLTLLEGCIRDNLNEHAPRRMAVLNPLKVVVENYPEDKVEEFEVPNHPNNPDMGKRKVHFSKVLYIEKSDFMENPPKKFFRLGIGREVRFKYAYLLTCTDVVKDENGEVIEVKCTYDPESKGGSAPDGRKVKGTIHWVCSENSIDAEVRLYDRLFSVPNPLNLKDGKSFTEHINPDSLNTISAAKFEKNVSDLEPEKRYQFERVGYFCVDRYDSNQEKPVFNRIVTLKDTWAKVQKK